MNEMDKLREAVGVLSESGLLVLRSALDVGATHEEAHAILSCYVHEMLNGWRYNNAGEQNQTDD